MKSFKMPVKFRENVILKASRGLDASAGAAKVSALGTVRRSLGLWGCWWGTRCPSESLLAAELCWEGDELSTSHLPPCPPVRELVLFPGCPRGSTSEGTHKPINFPPLNFSSNTAVGMSEPGCWGASTAGGRATC